MGTKHRITTTRPIARCGGALALALALAGCGAADADTEAGTEQTGPTEQAGPTTIEVVGDDFTFAGLPETVVAGSTLRLTNTSDVELHEIVAIRLPDDEERPAAELLQLPPDEFPDLPPAAVILAPPNGDGRAVVGTGTLDEAGRYLLFCAIPIGADPDEYLEAAQTSDGPPQVDGGPPHFTEGMWAELTVVDG